MNVVGSARGANKIVPLETFAERVAELKAAGKSVVLCHGVFDLLHYGHILHFEEARRQGDALVVTITPDVYVNKGPNRPAFTEAYRAQMLAALEIVDYVAINKWPTAVEMLRAVQPNVYAKGPDYRDRNADITGKIGDEEAAVYESGGRIYFTEAPATTEQLMVNLHLVDEFGLNLPRDFEVTIHNALQTVQQSPEVWDAGLEKYAESADAARLLNQLFGFTGEIERALVNIKEGA